VGFADSLAGLGRGLLAGLESVAGQILPQFIQAGSQFLVQKAFPGQTASLPPGMGPVRFPQGDRPRAPLPGELPFGTRAGVPQLGTGTLQQQIDRALTPGGGSTGGIVPRDPRFQLPNLFQDIPFAQTFEDLVRAGFPPTLPDIFPRGIFPSTAGAPTMPPAPSSRTEMVTTAGQFQLGPAPFAGGCPSLFSAGGMSARPVSMFMVPNPVTGKPTFFKHAGRPILFSGDLRACKTVNRIAARARRSRGR